jgi:hypothetical protein
MVVVVVVAVVLVVVVLFGFHFVCALWFNILFYFKHNIIIIFSYLNT